MFVTLRHFDGQIVVNWQALDAGIEEIDGRSKDMFNMLEELGNSLSTKLADWRGSANQSFEDVKTGWFTAANNVKLHLDDIRGRMQQARDVMYEQEMANARRFGG